MPERLALHAADRQGTDRCRAKSADIARDASTALSPSVAKHQDPRQAVQVTGGPIPVAAGVLPACVEAECLDRFAVRQAQQPLQHITVATTRGGTLRRPTWATGRRTARRRTAGRLAVQQRQIDWHRRGPRTALPCRARGRLAWGSHRPSSALPDQESHRCDSPRSRINRRACTPARNTSHLGGVDRGAAGDRRLLDRAAAWDFRPGSDFFHEMQQAATSASRRPSSDCG